MNQVLKWILGHPEEVGMLVSLLITVTALLVQHRWAGIRAAIQEIMHAAERARRQGKLPPTFDGPQVFEWVVTTVMISVVPSAPAWLRAILTEKRVRAMVQKLFNSALDWIDDGQFNSSNKPPADPASEVAATYDPARNAGITYTPNGDGTYSVKPVDEPPDGGPGRYGIR